MAAKIEPLMTVDDLEAMPDDTNRYEVIEGELFVSRAPGLSHQVVAGNIQHQIRKYLDEKPIGSVIATPGLIFSQYSEVIPDLVFYSLARGQEIIADGRLNAAPEIVIEILSPGRDNISRDRIAKRQLYAKHGVSEYWIVDSENRSVEIYRLTGPSLDLLTVPRNNDEITSQVLPGFNCPLAKIFES